MYLNTLKIRHIKIDTTLSSYSTQWFYKLLLLLVSGEITGARDSQTDIIRIRVYSDIANSILSYNDTSVSSSAFNCPN